jgi:hypothetical protein
LDSNVERESMLLSVEGRNEKRRKPCKVVGRKVYIERKPCKGVGRKVKRKLCKAVGRKVKREETLQSGRKES